ncbi:MAG: winged helix-turn-helix domain-containing protein, partial [Pseudomonadota bacterium]
IRGHLLPQPDSHASDRHTGRRSMITIGDWQLDPAARILARGGQVSRLTPKAVAVATALAEADGGVVSREDLLDRAWPDVVVGEEVLTQAVKELRRALGDAARNPAYLETVHGTGYRLKSAAPAGAFSGEGTSLPAGSILCDLDIDDGFAAIEGFTDYLEACARFNDGGRENVGQSVRQFDAVLSRASIGESTAGLALAGKARSLGFLGLYYGGGRSALAEAARASAEAVRAAPQEGFAHAAHGFSLSFSGRPTEGFARFERALALDPQLAETHYLLGRACFTGGRPREGALLFERAAALAPEDYHVLLVAAKARRSAGDLRGSAQNLSRALARIDAESQIAPTSPRRDSDRLVCQLALGLGDRKAQIREALDLLATGDPYLYYLSGALAVVGEEEASLAALEAIVGQGWSHRDWLMSDLSLAPVRTTRQFRHLEASLV